MTTKQTTGLHRNITDKYYTAPDTVKLCMSIVNNYLNIGNNDIIIEPSAGNGAFIPLIKELCNYHIFYDLEPEHPEIILNDYLYGNYTNLKDDFDKIHIIGNPPFGRQSSLAIKFIKKSAVFCDSISFILPKSFKKDSMRQKFPINFHLCHETDLPDNSFLVGDRQHDVPCIFQVWVKKNFPRKIPDKLEPINFTFVTKNNNPDIAVRRVGVYAGKISEYISDKNIQTHYFIKFTNNRTIEENIKLLSNITYDTGNTVGPKSISKQELIHKYNSIINAMSGTNQIFT